MPHQKKCRHYQNLVKSKTSYDEKIAFSIFLFITKTTGRIRLQLAETGPILQISASNHPTYKQETLQISWTHENDKYSLTCPDLATFNDLYKQCKIQLTYSHHNLSVPDFKITDSLTPISAESSPRIPSGTSTPRDSTPSRSRTTIPLIAEEPIPLENQVPYQKAIETLRNIVNEKSPRDKLGCILRTFRETIKCVTDFWDKEGCDPVVGADDLVPIFAYVILKANIPHLYSEMNFIWEFASDAEMNGNYGYGYATFQVGVEAVARLDKDEEQSPSKRATATDGILEKREQLVYTRRMTRVTRDEDDDELSMSMNS